jgi:hypothetical protein
MPARIVWPVSASTETRKVGSSAASFGSDEESYSMSACDFATTAI